MGNNFVKLILKAKEKQFHLKNNYAKVTIFNHFGAEIVRLVLDYLHSGIFDTNLTCFLSNDYKHVWNNWTLKEKLILLLRCMDYFCLLEPHIDSTELENSRVKELLLIKRNLKLADAKRNYIVQKPEYYDLNYSEHLHNQLYHVMFQICKRHKIRLVSCSTKRFYDNLEIYWCFF